MMNEKEDSQVVLGYGMYNKTEHIINNGDTYLCNYICVCVQ